MLGFDMQPDSASIAQLGTLDTCVSVRTGDTFDVDVFAANLQSLTAFNLRVDFDPAKLSLDPNVDYGYMLAQGSGSIFPQTDEEKPGRWFLSAGNGNSTASGSGILARMHLTALHDGTSSLSITSEPTAYGPQLLGARGAVIGDANGDKIWDGQLSGGTVRIGSSCAPSTPVVTPSPVTPAPKTPVPATGGSPQTPGQPTSAPGAGAGDGGGSDPGGSGPQESSGPLVGNVNPSPGPQDTGVPAGVASPGATDRGEPNAGDAGGNGGNSDPSTGVAGGGDGNTGLILAIIALVALAGAAVAGGLLLWSRRSV